MAGTCGESIAIFGFDTNFGIILYFLRSHKLCDAVRTLLENLGHLYYYDKTAEDAERHVEIIPLYALSNL